MRQREIIRSDELTAQVISCDEEACLLQVEIDIGIDERIIAHLYFVLHLELLGSRFIIRSIIGRVVVHICSDLDTQHFRQLELQVQVGVHTQVGSGSTLWSLLI